MFLLPQTRRTLAAAAALKRTSSNKKMSSGLSQEIEDLHNLAVSRGESTYIDPQTGYTVFTILAERKGGCCGYKCRHCPFGHFNVKSENRCTKLPGNKPVLLRARRGSRSDDDAMTTSISAGPSQVLFWSGGKDSLLALRALERENSDCDVTLLTTYDPRVDIVPEQDIPIATVFDQAKHLKRDLIAVPNTGEYVPSLLAALDLLKGEKEGKPVLVFGDLHIRELREWRENSMREHGYECKFPLFDVPYSVLAERLFAESGLRVQFSAINSQTSAQHGFKVGDDFTPQIVQKLSNASTDAFGENGEFHTLVTFTT